MAVPRAKAKRVRRKTDKRGPDSFAKNQKRQLKRANRKSDSVNRTKNNRGKNK